MNWIYWIGGGALVLAIIAAIFWYASKAKWVADLIWSFVAMAINAFLPILLKRMPPEEELAWNEFNRSNPSKEEIREWKKAYRKRQKNPPQSQG